MTTFPDLLTDDLRREPWKGHTNVYAGHCYVASEALFHLLGGYSAGWTARYLRHEGSPHWFLQHKDGTVIDPTEDQFSTPVPYHLGRGIGFLTSQPSKRARVLIDRLKDMP